MNPRVERRASKYLGKLASFRRHHPLDAAFRFGEEKLPTAVGEVLLGAYDNRRGTEDDFVFFSDSAVYWWGEHTWRKAEYLEMVEVDRPPGPKMHADELLLKMKSGRTEHLFIRGGTENTRDLFAVWTFLLHMPKDLRWFQSYVAPIAAEFDPPRRPEVFGP